MLWHMLILKQDHDGKNEGFASKLQFCSNNRYRLHSKHSAAVSCHAENDNEIIMNSKSKYKILFSRAR